MKVKYRVLESRYSDGSVRFFPQSGDWWHGWRFFGTRLWGCYSNRDYMMSLWFDSFDEAARFLEAEIQCRQDCEKSKEAQKDKLVYQVKQKIHNCTVEEIRDESKDED